MLVFNLGFNKKSERFKEEHWLYLPESKYNFYRVGFYDNILEQDKLSMYIEIGFSKDEKIDIDTELEKTLAGLLDMGVTDENTKLCEYLPIIMDPAYVHINGETEEKISKWLEYDGERGVYSIGRYGRRT